jgi:arylsulfatase A-like enzyme
LLFERNRISIESIFVEDYPGVSTDQVIHGVLTYILMNMRTPGTDASALAPSGSFLILNGLVLSLTLGFFDTIFSMLSSGWHWSWILLPTATTVLTVFILYILSWLALRPLFVKLFSAIETSALATSLAFFMGMLFILLMIQNLIHPPESKVELLKQGMLLLISGLAGVGVYFIVRSLRYRLYLKSRISNFLPALPVILAEVIIILCLFASRPHLRFRVFLFSALATCLLYLFCGSRIAVRLLLPLLAATVFLAPLLDFAFDSANVPTLPQEHRHKIKHVILITVDTLRADVLSAYDNKARPTPNIQKLANDSVFFKNAIAPAPWTQPSFVSMMTGVSPLVHQSTRHQFGIPRQIPMIAERMSDAGYYTAAFGTNPVLATFSRGFKEFHFLATPLISGFGSSIIKQLFPDKYNWNPDAARLSEISADWLRKHYKQDFLLWVHYFDPHVPYSPPSKYVSGNPPAGQIGQKYLWQDYWQAGSGDFVPSAEQRKWIKDLYLAEVQYVDDSIGRLLASLRSLNLYDESLIIFASDHGEEFWEHGRSGHGRSLYREVLWVPFMVKVPFSHSKRQVDKLVSITSIAPSILDFTGIDYQPASLSDISLAPLCLGNMSDFEEQPIVSTGLAFFDEEYSVTWKDRKYIKTITGHEELYNSSNDPYESLSLVSSDREQLSEAKKILKETENAAERLRKHYGISGPYSEEMDPQRRDAMRALGYIH